MSLHLFYVILVPERSKLRQSSSDFTWTKCMTISMVHSNSRDWVTYFLHLNIVLSVIWFLSFWTVGRKVFISGLVGSCCKHFDHILRSGPYLLKYKGSLCYLQFVQHSLPFVLFVIVISLVGGLRAWILCNLYKVFLSENIVWKEQCI